MGKQPQSPMVFHHLSYDDVHFQLGDLKQRQDEDNMWMVGKTMGMCILPSGDVKIAIENGHRNSGFSH